MPDPSSDRPDGFRLPEGFSSGFSEIDGVRLHRVVGGSGPVAMLVHGFAQTWYEWHRLMPLLARRFTVVAPDLPGLGLSSPPRGSYAGQDVAPLLHGLARQFAGEATYDLVAHDIGIWNTYPIAALEGRAIGRAVFMEAPIPDRRIHEFPAFTPEGESLVWHFSFFAAANRLAETLLAGRERFFLEHFIKAHATNRDVFTPELLDLYAASFAKPASLHASFEYYRALNETARRNAGLGSGPLAMKVLAIGGGGPGGLGRFQIEQMREYASDVEGRVIAGCGHWVPEEAPEELGELVHGFLTRDR